MLTDALSGLAQVFQPAPLALMLLGVAIGFVVGILPGLGGAVTLALMLPFTYDMQPVEAFAFLLAVVLGALAERYLFLSHSLFGWTWLTRPVVLVIGTAIGLAMLAPTIRRLRNRRRADPPRTPDPTSEEAA